MKTFKSKIDCRLTGVVFLVLAITAIPMIVPQIIWIGIVIIFFVALFFIDMMVNTKYTIDGKILKIKCGVFYNRVYDINDIIEIMPTRNMESSPAMSLDRIEIRFNRQIPVIISPDEKERFVRELQSINNKIMLKNANTGCCL